MLALLLGTVLMALGVMVTNGVAVVTAVIWRWK
jgi:hypothetical protein